MSVQVPKITTKDINKSLIIKAGSKLYPKGISASAFKRAWDQGFNGSGIRVAVIDTGVDGNHPDLKGQVIKSVNLTNERNIINPHGTHVAGTIAGTGKKWVVGGAPGCKILSYKALSQNGGAISTIITAINQAVNDGCNIINMSLGAVDVPQADINALTNCINNAYNRGVICIVASGNDGISTCSIDPYEWPAAVQVAESIAACDVQPDLDTITLASFSNENDRVDVSACGVNVVSTVLNGLYGIYSGTSMATPHVSAMAAVLAQRLRRQNPRLSGANFSRALTAEIKKNVKYFSACGNISVGGKNLITTLNCKPPQEGNIKSLEIYPKYNTSFGNGFVRYDPTKGPVIPGGTAYYYSGIFLGHQL